MTNRIPNKLTIGDVIRNKHRPGDTRYRVEGFNEQQHGVVCVYLKRVGDGKPLVRTLPQIFNNWRRA